MYLEYLQEFFKEFNHTAAPNKETLICYCYKKVMSNYFSHIKLLKTRPGFVGGGSRKNS